MAKEKKETTGLSTAEVADIVSDRTGHSVDAKTMRAFIRSAKIFGDRESGKRYTFTGPKDSKIQEICDGMDERRRSRKTADDGGKKKKKKAKDGKSSQSNRERRKLKKKKARQE